MVKALPAINYLDQATSNNVLMAKYLRDLALWLPPSTDEAKRWGYSTNFLEVLYLDSLPKLETHGVAKVVVTPSHEKQEPKIELMVNPDVFQVIVEFDFDSYWSAGKELRKRLALDLLQSGLLHIAKARSWNTSPLQEAYHAALAKGLVSERPWTKRVTSPNKKLAAEIWCRYDSDRADLFVHILRGKKEIQNIPVATVKPGDVWIREAIGKLEWIAANEIKLTSKDGAHFHRITFEGEELVNR